MTGSDEVEQSVESLIRQAAAGSELAWRSLLDRYASRVFGLLFQQCRDPDIAEEITQQTFVKLVESLGQNTYTEQGRFEAWLFRVAMNRLRDEMRRRKRQAKPVDMTPGAGRSQDSSGGIAIEAVQRKHETNAHDPAASMIREQEALAIQQIVSTLNDQEREVIYLRFTAELSFQQIAETLDQPLGTVLARNHRALRKLKEKLEQEHV